MKELSVLCLTDHGKHSKENSVYAILREVQRHPLCFKVYVASRSNTKNKSFFEEEELIRHAHAEDYGRLSFRLLSITKTSAGYICREFSAMKRERGTIDANKVILTVFHA